MSDAIRQYTIKYPNARTSTVRYLVAREAKTKQLLEELAAMEQKDRKPVQFMNWFSRMMAWWR